MVLRLGLTCRGPGSVPRVVYAADDARRRVRVYASDSFARTAGAIAEPRLAPRRRRETTGWFLGGCERSDRAGQQKSRGCLCAIGQPGAEGKTGGGHARARDGTGRVAIHRGELSLAREMRDGPTSGACVDELSAQAEGGNLSGRGDKS